MRRAIRSLWAEPPPPRRPARTWLDRGLVAAFVVAAVVEVIVNDDLVWGPVALVVTVGLAFLLPLRRSRPLAVIVVTLGTLAALNVVALLADVGQVGVYASAYVVLLPYALCRWGSGREVLIGAPIVLAFLGVGALSAPDGIVAALVGGLLFFILPAIVAVAIRYRSRARLQEIDGVRLREREQLARELHDTVAHHVSAIAIQAQAGRTLAEAHPDRAHDALAVIEEEASRTLAEMRAIVSLLRSEEEQDLAPHRGVADVRRMARSDGERPHVAVALSGDLENLPRPVDAAIYRLVQESITNTLRHARHATRIDVSVTGDADGVRVVVADDGDPLPGRRPDAGFGLVGMAERTALLHGTFEAGPAAVGWRVSAVVPRRRSWR